MLMVLVSLVYRSQPPRLKPRGTKIWWKKAAHYIAARKQRKKDGVRDKNARFQMLPSVTCTLKQVHIQVWSFWETILHLTCNITLNNSIKYTLPSLHSTNDLCIKWKSASQNCKDAYESTEYFCISFSKAKNAVQ